MPVNCYLQLNQRYILITRGGGTGPLKPRQQTLGVLCQIQQANA